MSSDSFFSASESSLKSNIVSTNMQSSHGQPSVTPINSNTGTSVGFPCNTALINGYYNIDELDSSSDILDEYLSYSENDNGKVNKAKDNSGKNNTNNYDDILNQSPVDSNSIINEQENNFQYQRSSPQNENNSKQPIGLSQRLPEGHTSKELENKQEIELESRKVASDAFSQQQHHFQKIFHPSRKNSAFERGVDNPNLYKSSNSAENKVLNTSVNTTHKKNSSISLEERQRIRDQRRAIFLEKQSKPLPPLPDEAFLPSSNFDKSITNQKPNKQVTEALSSAVESFQPSVSINNNEKVEPELHDTHEESKQFSFKRKKLFSVLKKHKNLDNLSISPSSSDCKTSSHKIEFGTQHHAEGFKKSIDSSQVSPTCVLTPKEKRKESFKITDKINNPLPKHESSKSIHDASSSFITQDSQYSFGESDQIESSSENVETNIKQSLNKLPELPQTNNKSFNDDFESINKTKDTSGESDHSVTISSELSNSTTDLFEPVLPAPSNIAQNQDHSEEAFNDKETDILSPTAKVPPTTPIDPIHISFNKIQPPKLFQQLEEHQKSKPLSTSHQVDRVRSRSDSTDEGPVIKFDYNNDTDKDSDLEIIFRHDDTEKGHRRNKSSVHEEKLTNLVETIRSYRESFNHEPSQHTWKNGKLESQSSDKAGFQRQVPKISNGKANQTEYNSNRPGIHHNENIKWVHNWTGVVHNDLEQFLHNLEKPESPSTTNDKPSHDTHKNVQNQKTSLEEPNIQPTNFTTTENKDRNKSDFQKSHEFNSQRASLYISTNNPPNNNKEAYHANEFSEWNKQHPQSKVGYTTEINGDGSQLRKQSLNSHPQNFDPNLDNAHRIEIQNSVASSIYSNSILSPATPTSTVMTSPMHDESKQSASLLRDIHHRRMQSLSQMADLVASTKTTADLEYSLNLVSPHKKQYNSISDEISLHDSQQRRHQEAKDKLKSSNNKIFKHRRTQSQFNPNNEDMMLDYMDDSLSSFESLKDKIIKTQEKSNFKVQRKPINSSEKNLQSANDDKDASFLTKENKHDENFSNGKMANPVISTVPPTSVITIDSNNGEVKSFRKQSFSSPIQDRQFFSDKNDSSISFSGNAMIQSSYIQSQENPISNPYLQQTSGSQFSLLQSNEIFSGLDASMSFLHLPFEKKFKNQFDDKKSAVFTESKPKQEELKENFDFNYDLNQTRGNEYASPNDKKDPNNLETNQMKDESYHSSIGHHPSSFQKNSSRFEEIKPDNASSAISYLQNSTLNLKSNLSSFKNNSGNLGQTSARQNTVQFASPLCEEISAVEDYVSSENDGTPSEEDNYNFQNYNQIQSEYIEDRTNMQQPMKSLAMSDSTLSLHNEDSYNSSFSSFHNYPQVQPLKVQKQKKKRIVSQVYKLEPHNEPDEDSNDQNLNLMQNLQKSNMEEQRQSRFNEEYFYKNLPHVDRYMNNGNGRLSLMDPYSEFKLQNAYDSFHNTNPPDIVTYGMQHPGIYYHSQKNQPNIANYNKYSKSQSSHSAMEPVKTSSLSYFESDSDIETHMLIDAKNAIPQKREHQAPNQSLNGIAYSNLEASENFGISKELKKNDFALPDNEVSDEQNPKLPGKLNGLEQYIDSQGFYDIRKMQEDGLEEVLSSNNNSSINTSNINSNFASLFKLPHKFFKSVGSSEKEPISVPYEVHDISNEQEDKNRDKPGPNYKANSLLIKSALRELNENPKFVFIKSRTKRKRLEERGHRKGNPSIGMLSIGSSTSSGSARNRQSVRSRLNKGNYSLRGIKDGSIFSRFKNQQKKSFARLKKFTMQQRFLLFGHTKPEVEINKDAIKFDEYIVGEQEDESNRTSQGYDYNITNGEPDNNIYDADSGTNNMIVIPDLNSMETSSNQVASSNNSNLNIFSEKTLNKIKSKQEKGKKRHQFKFGQQNTNTPSRNNILTAEDANNSTLSLFEQYNAATKSPLQNLNIDYSSSEDRFKRSRILGLGSKKKSDEDDSGNEFTVGNMGYHPVDNPANAAQGHMTKARSPSSFNNFATKGGISKKGNIEFENDAVGLFVEKRTKPKLKRKANVAAKRRDQSHRKKLLDDEDGDSILSMDSYRKEEKNLVEFSEEQIEPVPNQNLRNEFGYQNNSSDKSATNQNKIDYPEGNDSLKISPENDNGRKYSNSDDSEENLNVLEIEDIPKIQHNRFSLPPPPAAVEQYIAQPQELEMMRESQNLADRNSGHQSQTRIKDRNISPLPYDQLQPGQNRNSSSQLEFSGQAKDASPSKENNNDFIPSPFSAFTTAPAYPSEKNSLARQAMQHRIRKNIPNIGVSGIPQNSSNMAATPTIIIPQLSSRRQTPSSSVPSKQALKPPTATDFARATNDTIKTVRGIPSSIIPNTPTTSSFHIGGGAPPRPIFPSNEIHPRIPRPIDNDTFGNFASTDDEEEEQKAAEKFSKNGFSGLSGLGISIRRHKEHKPHERNSDGHSSNGGKEVNNESAGNSSAVLNNNTNNKPIVLSNSSHDSVRLLPSTGDLAGYLKQLKELLLRLLSRLEEKLKAVKEERLQFRQHKKRKEIIRKQEELRIQRQQEELFQQIRRSIAEYQ